MKNKEKLLLSLNEDITTEFALVELEARLETDPLLVIELFDNMASSSPDDQWGMHCTVPGAMHICTNTEICTVAEANIS
ncbi:hypothetical protein JGH11_15230 [Dysgonomonas sp. Marseille-P4677]|uniref:hypothetical protein n=1 Tax=Dysgonomonas sp. Marseille-P4677 TaxID=2364790 RepID=UPI00191234CA|nr:hypothetical protein [Dysgonomonas sp. Marseille-P4677]MBK5722227.1 hypothetical protein [Dysgonomonas sp. Marseille-P4677]